jgi:hypothetical protein
MLSPETCELIEDALGILLIVWTAGVVYFCLFVEYFTRWQKIAVLLGNLLLLAGSFAIPWIPTLRSCMAELEWVILLYRVTFLWVLVWGLRYLLV